MDFKKNIKAPRGSKLSCKGWPQEAALRMLMNNLDSEVAENPEELIVYVTRIPCPSCMKLLCQFDINCIFFLYFRVGGSSDYSNSFRIAKDSGLILLHYPSFINYSTLNCFEINADIFEKWPTQQIWKLDDNESKMYYGEIKEKEPTTIHVPESFFKNCAIIFKFNGIFKCLENALPTPHRKRKISLIDNDFSESRARRSISSSLSFHH